MLSKWSFCVHLQYVHLSHVHLCGVAETQPLLAFSSSRTAWRWSTPAFPSSASEGTVNSWPRPAGTTACGCSGGRSCSRWRCWSTTQIWCKALPSLTTRTPGRGCWLLAPKTRGSACGPCSVRNQRRPELLGFGWRLPSIRYRVNWSSLLKLWHSSSTHLASGAHEALASGSEAVGRR